MKFCAVLGASWMYTTTMMSPLLVSNRTRGSSPVPSPPDGCVPPPSLRSSTGGTTPRGTGFVLEPSNSNTATTTRPATTTGVRVHAGCGLPLDAGTPIAPRRRVGCPSHGWASPLNLRPLTPAVTPVSASSRARSSSGSGQKSKDEGCASGQPEGSSTRDSRAASRCAIAMRTACTRAHRPNQART